MSHTPIEKAALEAGIVELDALRMFDINPSDALNADAARSLIAKAKAAKPHVFSREKHVSEMTDAEYRDARAKIASGSY